MSKEEIALQLTMKSIERFSGISAATSEQYDAKLAEQVCNFYNYLYQNLDNTTNT